MSCAQASGVNSREAALLNGVAEHLDAVIRDRAEAAGFTYLDPVPAFTGHDECADTPFVWGKKAALLDICHPTRAGYRDGFAPRVLAAMGGAGPVSGGPARGRR